jgi:membrane-associated protein
MFELLNGGLVNELGAIGYLGVALVVFAESGLFFGFFLPGDSLLFTAGLLASSGVFDVYILVPLLIVSSILGNSVGYWFGKKLGPAIFNRDNSFFFKKKHVKDAEIFYDKYGGKAVVLGRFVPVIRTFVPIIAGIANMKYQNFLKFNIIGGVLWAGGLILLGFSLGKSIKDIDAYLLPIIFGIIIISFLPMLYEVWKNRKKS